MAAPLSERILTIGHYCRMKRKGVGRKEQCGGRRRIFETFERFQTSHREQG
jgi:hypothetical protein